MSTKHVRTTADLVRFGAGIKIDCRNCGAARTFSGHELARLCGTAPLRTLPYRLKCSRCGERDATMTVLPPV